MKPYNRRWLWGQDLNLRPQVASVTLAIQLSLISFGVRQWRTRLSRVEISGVNGDYKRCEATT